MQQNKICLIRLYRELWVNVDPKERLGFKYLLLLAILTSFLEVFTVGSIIPLLGSLMDGPINRKVLNVYGALGMHNDAESYLPVMIGVFIFLALLAGLSRMCLIVIQTKLSYKIGSDLSTKIYKKILSKPYLDHLEGNTSYYIDAVTYKANAVVGAIIIPSLTFLCSSIILITFFLGLILLEPHVTFLVSIYYVSQYLIISIISKKKMYKLSTKISEESARIIKIVQEGLGGIRDVIMGGNQNYYIKIFKNADEGLRVSQGSAQVIAVMPKYIIETSTMVLIGFIILYFSLLNSSHIATYVPLMAAVALCGQRTLPLLQQIFSAYSSIQTGRKSLHEALVYLRGEDSNLMIDTNIMEIKKDLTLLDIGFKYPGSSLSVIDKLNLTIKRGQKIGIVGSTGSGKSTLVDIIMGLLVPQHGSLILDDNPIYPNMLSSWKNSIAHVPQNIYLTDLSILENIAFGIPVDEIDTQRAILAAQQAAIHEEIISMDEQYATRVGERGIQLSGGQRQRIGIARALYKGTKIIILDEATNALDSSTERKVYANLNSMCKDVTIIIISHQLSALAFCDKVFSVGNGIIKEIKTLGEFDSAESKGG